MRSRKEMEPKKARIAIIITVITALLIIALSLCFLFDFNPFRKKGQAEKPTVSSAEETLAETQAPVVSAKPSIDDLKGCSDQLYYPKADSYLQEYQPMVTRSANRNVVFLQYKPEARKYYQDVIMEIENNTPVIAIAKENGYTLVLVKDGVAGWVLSQELELV